MSSVTRPRGPLPQRVYWFRRLLLLGTVAGLVVIGARLTGVSGGGQAPTSAATPVASTGSPAATPGVRQTTSAKPSAVGTTGSAPAAKRPRGEVTAKPKRKPTPLAQPTGPCLDSDIKIRPRLHRDAYAGRDVTIRLRLTTVDAAACYWEVAPDSVVVRLTSGDDRIWSSQHCPAAIERQKVVVRRNHPVFVDVVWSGQRSDRDCSRTTAWANPGHYRATAAALGAEPRQRRFRLLEPLPATITPSPIPLLDGKPGRDDDGRQARKKRTSDGQQRSDDGQQHTDASSDDSR
jgi:hypothetical protein